MEHQFFIRLVAASEAAAAKADARQEKLLKLLAEGSSERTAAQKELRRLLPAGVA